MGGVGRSWDMQFQEKSWELCKLNLKLSVHTDEGECEFRGKEAFKVKEGLTVK